MGQIYYLRAIQILYMELRQLKYFIKSAEYLNFSEAAKHLYITQSTLSQQIKQLEFELGFTLFARNSRHIELTEAGEEFLPYAKRTIQDAEDGVQRLYDLQNVKTGTVRIGVTYSLSTVLTEGVICFISGASHNGLYDNTKSTFLSRSSSSSSSTVLYMISSFMPGNSFIKHITPSVRTVLRL